MVFEASPRIAGLAESFTTRKASAYDSGAHFITNRLIATIGAGNQCRTRTPLRRDVWIDGRTYDYPFGLLRSPRYALSGAWAKARGWLSPGPELSAADWFRAEYGRALADEVALPLVEAWSGAPADTLAASRGGQDPLEHPRDDRPEARRAPDEARRGDRLLPRAAPERHTSGTSTPKAASPRSAERLAEGLESEIRTRSPVERILVDAGRVRAVQVGGVEIPVAAAVSTAPINVLAEARRTEPMP